MNSINIVQIYDNYNRSFYNSQLLSESPIPSIKNPKSTDTITSNLLYSNNTHYLCPICHQFPLIDFISNEYIYYTCYCEDRKKKLVKIKNLFKKEEKYMTFIENNILSLSKTFNNNLIGLKCTKEHDSGKYGKFRYYCVNCKKKLMLRMYHET